MCIDKLTVQRIVAQKHRMFGFAAGQHSSRGPGGNGGGVSTESFCNRSTKTAKTNVLTLRFVGESRRSPVLP